MFVFQERIGYREIGESSGCLVLEVKGEEFEEGKCSEW